MTTHRPRLDAATARIRNAIAACIRAHVADESVGLAVAISGGPDSLALAASTAFVAAKTGNPLSGIVIDHGLQPGSAQVAEVAAETARGFGVDRVLVRRVDVVDADGRGPEAAARDARYAGLAAAARELGAGGILLGHTRDDQAENVLLGLARGSGPASLSGMREKSNFDGLALLRPLLGIPRADILASCAALGIHPWQDPTNTDPRYRRSLIRTKTLPSLEADLGPGVAEALARTARLLSEDVDYLDAAAREAYDRLAFADSAATRFDRRALATLHPALRHRVYRIAVADISGASLASIHVDQIDRMVLIPAGPTRLDLPGTTVERAHATMSFIARH